MPADLAIRLGRKKKAAVRPGRAGKGLCLEIAQRGFLAPADIGLESGLVLFGILRQRVLPAERGPRLLQSQIVHEPAVVVERPVDAVELVAGHDISPHLALDIGKPLIVGLTEGFEGLHELVEGGRHRIRDGLQLRRNRHRGRCRCLLCHVVFLVAVCPEISV